MAGDPTVEVVRSYRARLAPLMPVQPQRDGVLKVPVYYAHPGDVPAVTALVWFQNLRVQSAVQSLRAGVRRRLVTASFEFVAGCELVGSTEQGADPEASPLQHTADDLVLSVYKAVDLDVADEEHLGKPDLVDWAKTTGYELENGLTANGVGSRLTGRVEFQARYID